MTSPWSKRYFSVNPTDLGAAVATGVVAAETLGALLPSVRTSGDPAGCALLHPATKAKTSALSQVRRQLPRFMINSCSLVEQVCTGGGARFIGTFAYLRAVEAPLIRADTQLRP